MKKKSLLFLAACSLMTLVACRTVTPTPTPTPEPEPEPEPLPDLPVIDGAAVKVVFYPDFSHTADKDIILTVQGNNGSLISQHPEDLTISNYPEFPVFLGWSSKETINNKNDLWNFDVDVIATGFSTLRMYGIWVAEGEGN